MSVGLQKNMFLIYMLGYTVHKYWLHKKGKWEKGPAKSTDVSSAQKDDGGGCKRPHERSKVKGIRNVYVVIPSLVQ